MCLYSPKKPFSILLASSIHSFHCLGFPNTPQAIYVCVCLPRIIESMGCYNESLMILHGWDNDIMCWAFSLILSGHARTWFNSLPEASISLFGQLIIEFLKGFVINSRRKKDATQLLNIWQGNKETLRQFMDRSRNATPKVPDLMV